MGFNITRTMSVQASNAERLRQIKQIADNLVRPRCLKTTGVHMKDPALITITGTVKGIIHYKRCHSRFGWAEFQLRHNSTITKDISCVCDRSHPDLVLVVDGEQITVYGTLLFSAKGVQVSCARIRI